MNNLIRFLHARSHSKRTLFVILLSLLVVLVLLRLLPTSITVLATTFGTTTIGPISEQDSGNTMMCNRYQANNSGTLQSLSAYIGQDDNESDSYSLAIYNDNAGNPGTLVAQGGTGAITPNAWNTRTMTANITAGTNYWLCYNTSTIKVTLNNLQYADGSTPAVAKAQSFGTWPTSFGTPGTSWAAKFSLYATVNVPPTPTPTLTPTSTPSPTLRPTSTPTPRPTATPTPTPVFLNWYGQPNWKYRKTITIDRTKVFGTQTNFPVLVNLSSDANLAANAQASGNDILFTDSTGTTKIPHEIEKYTASNGQLVAWVKVPSISSAANTTIYMYYGNPTATNQQNITGVWDSNFRMVYHMNDSSGALANDSTVNNKDALQAAVAEQPIAQSAGQVDTAMDFDGTADNLTMASPNLPTGDFTYQTWIRPDNVTVGTTIFMSPKSSDGGNAIALWVANCASLLPNKLCVSMNDTGTNVLIANQNISAGQWYHVAVTRSGSTVSLYINGIVDSTATNGSAIAFMGCPLYIGVDTDGGSGCTGGTKGNYFNGKLDDFKVSANARTADWIKTEYFNQNSPSTFYTLSAPEAYPTPPPAQPTPTLIPTFSIAGRVFNDTDKDGNQDSGEPAFPGVTVTISDPFVANDVTDSSGQYAFSGLQPGTYTVTVNLPANSTATSPVSRTVVIPGGGTINFGIIREYSISGRVFHDFNDDGAIQSGETAFQNVLINLRLFADPNSLMSVPTDSNGNFDFPNVQAGKEYVIDAKTPTGYRSTTANSMNFTLTGNQRFNFGFVQGTTNMVPGSCSGNTADIAIVFDHSGSMLEVDTKTGNTKLSEAKKASKAFVDVIAQHLPTARIALVIFSSSAGFPGNRSESSIVVPLTSNFTAVKQGIDNISVTHGTCIECGVKLANEHLEQNLRSNASTFVVVMTDGMANQTTTSNGVNVSNITAENAVMNEVIRGQRRHKGKTHTIGVGKGGVGEPQIDEPFLRQVAGTNGGTYLNNPDFGTIEDVYRAIAKLSISTGVISGFVFNDKNANGVYESSTEPRLPNFRVQATSPSLMNGPLIRTTNASGNYSFMALCNGRYAISQLLNPPWRQTTPKTPPNYSIGVISGNIYDNNNFGNRYGYRITGSVFNDINKNRFREGSELSVPGSVVTASAGDVSVNPDGTFLIEGLEEGSHLVSYTSPLPKDYILIYPKNGPPPSFLVTVGSACSVNTTTGASCIAPGDIANLNFAISDSIPWMQGYDLDMRFDDGLTNIVPKAPAYPQFVSTVTSASTLPGVFFSGDGFTDFGKGQVSNTGWQVGGAIYPEVANMSAANARKTSYTYLVQKATQAGVPVTDLFAAHPSCRPTRCNLPATLSSGIYRVTGDLVLENFNVPANRNIILLVNGNITIATPLQSQNGSTLIISSSGNITVDRNVGATPGSPLPAGQIQGFFSADRNFVIDGANDCLVGADKMLNIEGSVIVNAAGGGGKIINKRDLCGANPLFPSYTVKGRADFILNASPFLMDQITIYSEVAP